MLEFEGLSSLPGSGKAGEAGAAAADEPLRRLPVEDDALSCDLPGCEKLLVGWRGDEAVGVEREEERY